MTEKLVHLVYIHGFQGNDTTFQAFPTDLQRYVSAQIPSHLSIRIQSSLYPTYKSVKPITNATKNFLEWLSTQPPGPVILLGHSMGGLLAAEAATHPSNNPDKHPGAKPTRIVGMVAFDTPYLGMHPHVVVSGLASLFGAQDEKKSNKTEEEMNDDPGVNIVDGGVTDNWDEVKKNWDGQRSRSSLGSHSRSRSDVRSLSPSASPHPPHSPQTISKAPLRSPSPFLGVPVPMIDSTVAYLQEHSNDPLVRWIRKHSDEPFTAGKRWIVEHFQFGICMFDPPGLKERYEQLVAWQGGMWVNYWTQTVPKQNDNAPSITETESRRREVEDNDAALVETGMADNVAATPSADTPTSLPATPVPSPPRSSSNSQLLTLGAMTKSEAKNADKAAAKALKAEEKERRQAEKDREKQLKKAQKQRDAAVKASAKTKSGKHFIVLPTGLGQVLGGGEKWEKVVIAGVEDEVAAHTGLFIPEQNVEYDALVDRVGRTILKWCATL